jgi:hypothetical protein
MSMCVICWIFSMPISCGNVALVLGDGVGNEFGELNRASVKLEPVGGAGGISVNAGTSANGEFIAVAGSIVSKPARKLSW